MGRSGTFRGRLFGTRTLSRDRASGSATVRAHAWMRLAARQWVITNRPAFTEDLDAEMTRTTPEYRAVRPKRRAMSLALVLLLTGLALVVPAVGPAAAAAPALAVDRQVVIHQSTPSTGISSPALSTSQPGELILAFLMSDGSRSKQSFSSVTGGGLTWSLRQRSNAQRGTSEIWQAVAPAAVSNLVVTANRSSGSYVGSMVVTAFIGADTGVNGATTAAGRSGAPTATLTPTRAGSWVWAAGNDWDRAATRTVGADQTKVDEDLP